MRDAPGCDQNIRRTEPGRRSPPGCGSGRGQRRQPTLVGGVYGQRAVRHVQAHVAGPAQPPLCSPRTSAARRRTCTRSAYPAPRRRLLRECTETGRPQPPRRSPAGASKVAAWPSVPYVGSSPDLPYARYVVRLGHEPDAVCVLAGETGDVCPRTAARRPRPGAGVAAESSRLVETQQAGRARAPHVLQHVPHIVGVVRVRQVYVGVVQGRMAHGLECFFVSLIFYSDCAGGTDGRRGAGHIAHVPHTQEERRRPG